MEELALMPARVTVASVLRKAILAGEFAAGQELSLTEMAAKMGVSRTPVREAFQILEKECLIELRMNKGAMVCSIDRDFIQDHYGIRMLLEGEAVARAIDSGMDSAPLIALQEGIISKKGGELERAYVDYNLVFHTHIWRGAGSQKLYSFLESLWNGPSFSRAITEDEHRFRSIQEHGHILQCIKNGQRNEGRLAMEEHIRRSMHNIMDGLTIQSPSLP